jgi:signal transduction histidine kinase
MRIVVFFLLVYSSLFSLDIDFSKDEMQWIEKHPQIAYVGDPDWLPFEGIKGGKYIGIVADLLSYIEDETPLKFNILKTKSWSQSLKMMQSKKAILISQSKDYNKKTTELFSEVYYENPIIIVMLKGHDYVASLYEIADKKIAISSSEAFFNDIEKKYPTIKFQKVSSIKEGLESVAFGKNDAFVNTLAQTSYEIAKLQLNDLQIVGRTQLSTKLGFGISRDEPLLKSIINKVLRAITPDVKNKILSKWIHQKYVEKPDYTALYIALGVFFVIFSLSYYFYIRLKRETQDKLKAQYKMLEQQSKMASMGEMLDAVAHQWKQPLNALTMYLELLKSDFDDGVVDKGYIKEMQEGMDAQINHMVNTLSEFRNFFRPNNSSVKFNLLKTLNSVMFLTKDEFLKNQIEIKIDVDEDIIIKGNENEFKHLILNIINNAKDAFNENTLSKRIIEIKANEMAEFLSIDICDNAGGIPKSVINHIFESNFTTKKEGKGTGIGLYMSMQIVKKMGGELSVTNKDSGACFHISGIPKVF